MSQDLRIMAVTFEINAQESSAGKFSIPAKIQEIIDVSGNDAFPIIVEAKAGTFAGKVVMKSGPEIYGPDIRQVVQNGERIRVTTYSPNKRSG